jgi:prophage regulatory protein
MVTTHDGAGSGSEPPDELLWNINTVILKTGLSRPSIYRYMKRGQFPARRRIGPNRVAWLASEILAWIETCPCLPRAREGPPDRFPNAPIVRPEQGAVVRDGAQVDAPSFDLAMLARNQS